MAENKFRDHGDHHHHGELELTAKMLRGCTDKIAWPSKKIAKAGARSMIAKGYNKPGRYLNSYKCKSCGKWHNGHSSRPNRD